VRFLLFVKEKLPFEKDREKDEWISAQAARVIGTMVPDNIGGMIGTGVMDVVHWQGLHFAASMYVTLPILSSMFFLFRRHGMTVCYHRSSKKEWDRRT
jgi:hypothetical protein